MAVEFEIILPGCDLRPSNLAAQINFCSALAVVLMSKGQGAGHPAYAAEDPATPSQTESPVILWAFFPLFSSRHSLNPGGSELHQGKLSPRCLVASYFGLLGWVSTG